MAIKKISPFEHQTYCQRTLREIKILTRFEIVKYTLLYNDHLIHRRYHLHSHYHHKLHAQVTWMTMMDAAFHFDTLEWWGEELLRWFPLFSHVNCSRPRPNLMHLLGTLFLLNFNGWLPFRHLDILLWLGSKSLFAFTMLAAVNRSLGSWDMTARWILPSRHIHKVVAWLRIDSQTAVINTD